jgi:hypothetical protein
LDTSGGGLAPKVYACAVSLSVTFSGRFNGCAALQHWEIKAVTGRLAGVR